MTALLPPDAPLSPHLAFVVQLREGTALTPEGCTAASRISCRGRRPSLPPSRSYGRLWHRCWRGKGATRFPGPPRLPSKEGNSNRMTCRRTFCATVGDLRPKPKENGYETSQEHGAYGHDARRVAHHRTAGGQGRDLAARAPRDLVQFSPPTFVDPPKVLLGDAGDGRCPTPSQKCLKDVDDLLFGRTHLLRSDDLVLGFQGVLGSYLTSNSEFLDEPPESGAVGRWLY